MNALYGSYLAGVGLLLPGISMQFGMDAPHMGRLMSAGFTGAVLSVLACGALSDRFGRKLIASVAGTLFTLGLILMSCAKSELMALCAAPLVGAGGAGMQTVCNALASEQAGERRSIVLNTCQVMFAVGAVGGPLLMAPVIGSGLGGWRIVYRAMCVPAVICTVAVLVFASGSYAKKPLAAGDQQSQSSSFRLASLGFAMLCLAQALYAGAEVGFFGWMPVYLVALFRDGAVYSGSAVSVFWGGMACGRYAMNPLLLRFRALSLGGLLAFSGAVSALAAAQSASPVLTIGWVFLTGLFFGGVYSSILVEASRRYSANLGAAIGLIAACSSSGTVVIPWLMGLVSATVVGWRGAMSVASASAVLSAVVLAIAARQSNLVTHRSVHAGE